MGQTNAGKVYQSFRCDLPLDRMAALICIYDRRPLESTVFPYPSSRSIAPAQRFAPTAITARAVSASTPTIRAARSTLWLTQTFTKQPSSCSRRARAGYMARGCSRYSSQIHSRVFPSESRNRVLRRRTARLLRLSICRSAPT